MQVHISRIFALDKTGEHEMWGHTGSGVVPVGAQARAVVADVLQRLAQLCKAYLGGGVAVIAPHVKARPGAGSVGSGKLSLDDSLNLHHWGLSRLGRIHMGHEEGCQFLDCSPTF